MLQAWHTKAARCFSSPPSSAESRTFVRSAGDARGAAATNWTTRAFRRVISDKAAGSPLNGIRQHASAGGVSARRLPPLPGPVCICLDKHMPVQYIMRVESAFDIIAEPNRRAILSLLVSSEQSVGEIERRLRMPQPTVSKHLRVLREAGFVESRWMRSAASTG